MAYTRRKRLILSSSFGRRGRELVNQVIEILFPIDGDIWTPSIVETIKPLSIPAFRTFVILPEALVLMAQGDCRIVNRRNALDALDDSHDYGKLRFDDDLSLEESFFALSTAHLHEICGTNPLQENIKDVRIYSHALARPLLKITRLFLGCLRRTNLQANSQMSCPSAHSCC